MAYQNPIPHILKHPVRFLSIVHLILMWTRIYFTTQERTSADGATVVETPVDERVPSDEQSIYPYLFACVYILYVVWHVLDRLSADAYRRTRRAYCEMILLAQKVFVERPTRMRDRARSRHPLTLLTQTIDAPTNCFPSLHVALVMLSYQIVKDGSDRDDLLLSAMKQSCIDICRSTLKTKQHSMIDVIGGLELSRQVYLAHFDGPFSELLPELLPELDAGELAAVDAVRQDAPGLLPLLDRLLELFGRWPAARSL